MGRIIVWVTEEIYLEFCGLQIYKYYSSTLKEHKYTVVYTK